MASLLSFVTTCPIGRLSDSLPELTEMVEVRECQVFNKVIIQSVSVHIKARKRRNLLGDMREVQKARK